MKILAWLRNLIGPLDKAGRNDLSRWKQFGGTLDRPPPPPAATPRRHTPPCEGGEK